GAAAPFERRRGVEQRRVGPLAARDAGRLLDELLRPPALAAALVARAAAAVGRSPLRLRSAAAALRDAWGSAGTVPRTADLPDLSTAGHAAILPAWAAGNAAVQALLSTLT